MVGWIVISNQNEGQQKSHCCFLSLLKDSDLTRDEMKANEFLRPVRGRFGIKNFLGFK